MFLKRILHFKEPVSGTFNVYHHSVYASLELQQKVACIKFLGKCRCVMHLDGMETAQVTPLRRTLASSP